MVAAKPLLATTLAALAFVAGAAAESGPTVRITAPDQAEAKAALLRLSDFGSGWSGGVEKPTPLDAPSCPGGDSHASSSVVVGGHADASFRFQPAGVALREDVEVLTSAAAVRVDFTRTITSRLPGCLAERLERSGAVGTPLVSKLPFPLGGSVSAVYRARVAVRADGKLLDLVSDYLFFATGRVEFSLNLVAPAEVAPALNRFELVLAQSLLARAARAGG